MKAKARKWDENAIRKLKERRSALQEELQKLHRTGRKELDVEMKRNQIHQLEARRKFANQEINKMERETLPRLEQELDIEQGGPDGIMVHFNHF